MTIILFLCRLSNIMQRIDAKTINQRNKEEITATFTLYAQYSLFLANDPCFQYVYTYFYIFLSFFLRTSLISSDFLDLLLPFDLLYISFTV